MTDQQPFDLDLDALSIFKGPDPPDEEDKPQLAEIQPCAPEQSKDRHTAQRSKKKRRSHPLLRLLIKVAVIAAIFVCVFTFVLGIQISHGNRMHPFIMDGDLVVTYKLEPYHVGDAVVYKNPETGEKAISRIVAIGRNEIQITEIGELLINGSVPEENVFYATKELSGSELLFPYQMSEEGYFLLDDYRTVGKDSRLFGEVKEDDLLGKIVYVFRRRGI